MVVYYKHGFNLSEGQKSKLSAAYKNGVAISLRLTKKNLQGNDMLALTQTQLNKIEHAEKGSRQARTEIKLSQAQLKHMVKTGGFLPLLTLIPLIAGAVGAAGGLTGGIASAVSAAKSNAEQERHNRAIEEQVKSGTGPISDFAGKVPLVGSHLKFLLQKIGLGTKDLNEICNGGCVCKNKFRYKQIGSGLFIEPAEGSGLFLGPWTP